MLTALILFGNKVGLALGLGWAIRLFLSVSVIWLEIVMLTGSSYLVKRHIEIGVELVLLYAKKGREKLAIKTANHGIRLLQKSIKKRQERAGDDMIRSMSKTLVVGVNQLIKRDCTSTLTAILDDRMNAFAKAIQRGRSRDAESLSRVAMAVLNAAMDIGPDASFTSTYLSKAFVRILHESSSTRETLIKQLINDRAAELHTLARQNNSTAVRMLALSIVTILKTAGAGKYKNVLKITASATTKALMLMIDEKVEDIVQDVLKESVDGIYKAVTERNSDESASMSAAVQALLIAAYEAGSLELMQLLSESWIGSWDRVYRTEKQFQQDLQQLITQRGTVLEESIRVQDPDKDKIWAVSFELLLTTILQGRSELRERLSKSLVKSLVSAVNKGDEGPVGLMLRSRVPAITEALVSGDDTRANAVANTALQLLLTAINEQTLDSRNNLIRELSQVFVGALDAANLDGRPVLLDGLLEEVRTKAFTSSIVSGNEDEAQNLSTVGIELLLAAIRIQKISSRDSLAKSWVLALGNAVSGAGIAHGSNVPTAEMLISVWKNRLADVICSGDEREVRSHGIAAVILCLVARQVAHEATLKATRKTSRDEGREGVAASLERALVEAMATVIEEHNQRSKVNSLLLQIKEYHFTKVMVDGRIDPEEVNRSLSLIKQLADIARNTNAAVCDLITDKMSWGEYLPQ